MRLFNNGFFERYTDFVTRRYKTVLVVAVVITTLAGWSTSRFTIKTDFAELLPQDEPSILDLERYKKRMGGLSNMIVVVTGQDITSNKKAVDEISEEFAKLSSYYINYMKYHIKDEKRFYEENKHLYAELGDLKEIYK